MNLNKLNYPMFKITLTEAFLLIEARKRLGTSNSFLCTSVYSAGLLNFHHRQAETLTSKVRVSIDGYALLTSFLGIDNPGFRENSKIRKIWIKKLLAHNGY